VLYYVAISRPAAPQIAAVQRTYDLASLIPTAEALDADVVRLQPLLRDAREQITSAKDAWLKVASGRSDHLAKLVQLLGTANAKAAEIGDPALSRLTSALVERLAAMPAEGTSEPLAMEFATALLLAESAFENFGKLSPEFGSQVDAMLKRLDEVSAGRAAVTVAPLLDEMSRRAQERVLLSQVMREVQANLRHMEQVLDAFFRDHTRRLELAALAKDSRQIRGALRILDLDDADRLLALCQTQIEGYANPDTPVDEEGLELLAESLSGLGFYIEAVLHQRADRGRIIAPLIAKRLGEAPQPVVAQPQSVEDSVAELRAALPRLVTDVRNAPADAAARGELRGKLASLRDDADLLGDDELAAQATAALKEIDAGGEGASLAASVDLIVEAGSAPAPELSEETQRLLTTDASGLDAELLDIYLAEADEVLDTVAEHRRVPVDGGAVVVEQHGIAGGAHPAQTRVLDLLHHAAGDDLRMREHLLEIVDARARHADRHQGRLEVGGGSRPHRRLDDRDERVLVGLAHGVGREAQVAEMLGEAEHMHELAEQRVVGRAEGDVTPVAGFEQLIGRCEAVLVAERLRDVAGERRVTGRGLGVQVKRVHRHLAPARLTHRLGHSRADFNVERSHASPVVAPARPVRHRSRQIIHDPVRDTRDVEVLIMTGHDCRRPNGIDGRANGPAFLGFDVLRAGGAGGTRRTSMLPISTAGCDSRPDGSAEASGDKRAGGLEI